LVLAIGDPERPDTTHRVSPRLRQPKELIGSIIDLLGLTLRVPDHITMSRRATGLVMPRPQPNASDGSTRRLHLLADSTGLKLCGAGEWLLETHFTKARRSWRKLHLGVDAGTGQIMASTLTTKEVDDGTQVGPLLVQIAAPLSSFTGDGAYDQEGVYAAVAERYPDAAVIVPPRATAVPSEVADTAPTQRDGHLRCIAEMGRVGWQTSSGYNRRAKVETAIGRWKQVIGDGVRAHRDDCRATEVEVSVYVLNRMLRLGRPSYVRIS
jgi:hypothetical protein